MIEMGTSRNAFKPNSRAHRRPAPSSSNQSSIVDLPASGCELPVPDLPAGREWSEPEQARWEELWSSPQATQWDDTVIGTVTVLVVYEQAILTGTASAWMAQESRYASEALGLTPKAMAALGWRIVNE